jgi:hypothetical protein
MAANYVAQKIEQAMTAVLADAPLESRLRNAALHISDIAKHDLVPMSEWAHNDHKRFFEAIRSEPIQLQGAATALGNFLLEAASAV